MARTFMIDEEVLTVLQQSEILPDRVILPPVLLDRKLYQRVNKVLVGAGGK